MPAEMYEGRWASPKEYVVQNFACEFGGFDDWVGDPAPEFLTEGLTIAGGCLVSELDDAVSAMVPMIVTLGLA